MLALGLPLCNVEVALASLTWYTAEHYNTDNSLILDTDTICTYDTILCLDYNYSLPIC